MHWQGIQGPLRHEQGWRGIGLHRSQNRLVGRLGQHLGIKASMIETPIYRRSAMSSEQRPQDDAPLKSGLLRRLSRASGRSTHSVPCIGENANAMPSTQPWPSKTKLAAFKRLKTHFGKRGKFSKMGVPPSSWNAERDACDATPATPRAAPDEIVEPTSDVASGTKPGRSSGVESDSSGTSAAGDPPNAETAEPDNPNINDSQTMSAATLARRIHSLLSSFPPFYTLSPSGTFKCQKSPSSQSNPDMDAGSPLVDSKLLSLLSSASAMNGSISKGKESVWAILERLGYTPYPKSGCPEDGPSLPRDDDNVEVSSVMICCPLEPKEDTEVEVAGSEVVSINADVDETTFGNAATPKTEAASLSLWPFGKDRGKSETSSGAIPTPPAPKVKEVRVWFPSRTKISLQAAWWGYRMYAPSLVKSRRQYSCRVAHRYLPPPVMRVLNDKSLEAAKRAAMITAALSWLVSHTPIDMLPPQLKAVVGIVKGIGLRLHELDQWKG